MSSITLAFGRPTLADRIVSRSLTTDLLLIASGAALTSVAAQVAIPLWPVPLSLQTFAVLLVGASLGPLRGALSMSLYLVLGVAGLPVFADGKSGSLLTSTSGGFVVGFIAAAALAGWLAQRKWDHRVIGTAVTFIVGAAVMYAFGLPWLYSVLSTFDAATMQSYFGTTDVMDATLAGGLYPFIVGDLVKAGVAAGLFPLLWKAIDWADSRKSASQE